MACDFSTEFLCKCGKQKGWITGEQTTLPCTSCGRSYTGFVRINRRSGITELHAEEVLSTNRQPTNALAPFLQKLWNWIIGKNSANA